jgi:hypothetical protein
VAIPLRERSRRITTTRVIPSQRRLPEDRRIGMGVGVVSPGIIVE